MEATSALLMTLGLATLLGSWILLLITSWREDFAWGLCAMLMPPLAYFYALFRLDVAGGVLGLTALGWFLLFLSF